MMDCMAVLGLSEEVFGALDAILPNEGQRLVQRVQVFEGWGGIYHARVYSGIGQNDAGVALEEAIHTVVDGVMEDRRHAVRIVWNEPI